MNQYVFLAICKANGFVEPTPEYRFGAEAAGGPGKGLRKRLDDCGLSDWRFDYAWPAEKIALEVEGGVFTRGRHTRGKGYMEDMRKYNEAKVRGWIVLQCVPDTLCRSETIELLHRAFQLRRIERGGIA
jgi:hypothetical protein